MDTTVIRPLAIETATAAGIAPFGELIGTEATPARSSAFYKDKVRLHTASLFASDEDTQLTLASVDRRGMQVRWMERHFKHTQAFVPVGGKPFVMVLAPPGQAETPDVDQARAFLMAGDTGLLLHTGTWHEFPLALVDDTRVLVILRREATRSLEADQIVDNEGRGPDLDKKDIVRRLGVVLEARL